MAKLPKTVYVFHAKSGDADSLIVTEDQDTAFPVNDDGPVTVGVYESWAPAGGASVPRGRPTARLAGRFLPAPRPIRREP